MGRDSMKIGNDNIVTRTLLQAMGAGEEVRDVRHASKLNAVVEVALREATFAGTGANAIASRVMLCGDGSSGKVVCKTMAMIPDIASKTIAVVPDLAL